MRKVCKIVRGKEGMEKSQLFSVPYNGVRRIEMKTVDSRLQIK